MIDFLISTAIFSAKWYITNALFLFLVYTFVVDHKLFDASREEFGVVLSTVAKYAVFIKASVLWPYTIVRTFKS